MKLKMKLNNKKTIIITLIILLILIVLLVVVLIIGNNRKNNGEYNPSKYGYSENFAPSFLSEEEKNNLKIPVNSKIQVMTRDESGEVVVYKVINNDSDIVDPVTVEPISPRVISR
jgi:uncharacterized protein YpmS